MDMKNIILDVDGTLWNTTDIVADSWTRALRTCDITDITVTGADLRQLFGKTMDVIAQAILPGYPKEKRDEVMEVCCKYEQEDLVKNPCHILYPHVKETIITLSNERNIFIVSNCQSGYIELFLEKTGLGEYVKDIECFGNTGKQKNENIRILMERNGLEHAVYVGDTLGDCEAAKKAGVPFIFAEYGFGDVVESQMRIKSFEELLRLI